MKNKIDYKKVPIRILVLPFVLLISLIANLRRSYLHCKYFLIYGGEFITYTDKMGPVRILDLIKVIDELKKTLDEKH